MTIRIHATLIGLAVMLVFFGHGCEKRKDGTRTAEATPATTDPGFNPNPYAGDPPQHALFVDRAKELGVDFVTGYTNKSPLTLLELMGPGCAIADFDGDGHLDIFLVGATPGSRRGTCALYRNVGEGKMSDVTAGSGIETPGYYMGCAVGDLDNDGLPDIVVTGYGVVRLFRNLGGLKFQDMTEASGLKSVSPTDWHTAAAFGDFDRDGRIDLYIGKYVVFNEKTKQLCDYVSVKAACGPIFYDPQIGCLYRNQGGFKFKDVTEAWGVADANGKCLGAAFADVNGDGWPDLFLGNDEMPGDLFLNEGGKRYKSVGAASGVTLASNGMQHGAMGVDFGDYNRDGLPDLAITTFQAEPDALCANLGGGMFEHTEGQTGFGEATRQFVGFGIKFADFDNDGWLDMSVVNGHIHDNQELIDHFATFRQPMQLFMNQNGKSFADRTREAGAGFSVPFAGRGLAVGDLNEDGKLDMVATDAAGAVRILINQMPDGGNWVRLALTGSKSNRMAIGAKVSVVVGAGKWVAECTTGGSYLSASEPYLHFGLGKVTKIDRIDITWPSGKKSTLTDPKVNSLLQVKEP